MVIDYKGANVYAKQKQTHWFTTKLANYNDAYLKALHIHCIFLRKKLSTLSTC